MKHPAKFSPPILEQINYELELRLAHGKLILDPFAGVGTLNNQLEHWPVVCVEFEPEWATGVVGDALRLPFKDATFPCVVTSPPYGNRLADQDLRESAACNYAKSLGRRVKQGSAAGMQWGALYRGTMMVAIAEIKRVLKPGGLFILNVSDHVRNKKLQGVPQWFLTVALAEGFESLFGTPIKTQRMSRGANAEARADCEWLMGFQR